MIIYVSGPITGVENFAEAFEDKAMELREEGHTVINPCDAFGGRNDLSYETYMRFHIHTLLNVDAIHMLPGWMKSKGASFEYRMAEMLNLRILGASE
jgi:hypothetical protein